MREHFVKALATVSFLIATIVVTAGHAQAQSTPIRVKIPFDFVVGNKTLAAGEYFIRRAQPFSGDGMVAVSSVDGRTHLIRLTNAVQSVNPKTRITLVFHRYGTQNFLAQVWPDGGTRGRELPKSRTERDLERQSRDAGRIGKTTTPVMETVNITAGTQ
ncbi:MAG TPA: hypothetical protein VHS05_23640 [Pyrinomonadaceae bacterium]|nr:hypothetical protein [Pyrinomonadaceae bacterium]